MGLGGGKCASLLVAALEPQEVVEIGNDATTEWFAKFTVSRIFSIDAGVTPFSDIEFIMDSVAAGSDDAGQGIGEKCVAHALRIVALISAVLNVGGLSLD